MKPNGNFQRSSGEDEGGGGGHRSNALHEHTVPLFPGTIQLIEQSSCLLKMEFNRRRHTTFTDWKSNLLTTCGT